MAYQKRKYLPFLRFSCRRIAQNHRYCAVKNTFGNVIASFCCETAISLTMHGKCRGYRWQMPRILLANAADIVGKCHRYHWQMPRMVFSLVVEAVDNDKDTRTYMRT
jgi:hypothetical protein